MFKSHVAELLIVMNDKKNGKLAEVAVQAMAAICKADSECRPDDRFVMASLIPDRMLKCSIQSTGGLCDQDGYARHPASSQIRSSFSCTLQAKKRVLGAYQRRYCRNDITSLKDLPSLSFKILLIPIANKSCHISALWRSWHSRFPALLRRGVTR